MWGKPGEKSDMSWMFLWPFQKGHWERLQVGQRTSVAMRESCPINNMVKGGVDLLKISQGEGGKVAA